MENQKQGKGQAVESAYRYSYEWNAEEVDTVFETTAPLGGFQPPMHVNRKNAVVDRFVLHDGSSIFDTVERLPISIPANTERLLGYGGESRFIGVFLDMHKCRPIITDGAVSCMACSQAWDAIENHPIVKEGSSLSLFSLFDSLPIRCYLLDRKERSLYVGVYQAITEFLDIWTADVEIDLEHVKRLRRLAYENNPPYELTRREQEIFAQQRKIVVGYCTLLEQTLASL